MWWLAWFHSFNLNIRFVSKGTAKRWRGRLLDNTMGIPLGVSVEHGIAGESSLKN